VCRPSSDPSTIIANGLALVSALAALASVWLAWKAIRQARAQEREARAERRVHWLESMVLPLKRLQLDAIAAEADARAIPTYRHSIEAVQLALASLPTAGFANCHKLKQPGLTPDGALLLTSPALAEIEAELERSRNALRLLPG
jgi:hypothetical protein